MKKAINAWTVPGSVSFEDMFKSISEAGFQGIELNIDGENASLHSLTLDSDRKEYDLINALAAKYSLPVCSISTSLYGGTLGSDDAKEREFGKTVLRKQLECAAALGADGILVVPGGISETTSIRQATMNSKQSLLDMKPEIEKAKLKVGVENVWNGFFASPTDMARFIDDLACPYIGAYFDVGNVAVHSYPEYWIEILGQRIFKIHVKDFQRSGWFNGSFVNLLQGDIRWNLVVKALKAAGYDGCLTAELGVLQAAPEYLYRITSDALDIILKSE
jgi:hexulose-6-phosphate isomerase